VRPLSDEFVIRKPRQSNTLRHELRPLEGNRRPCPEVERIIAGIAKRLDMLAAAGRRRQAEHGLIGAQPRAFELFECGP
jgi:hypothetical protein